MCDKRRLGHYFMCHQHYTNYRRWYDNFMRAMYEEKRVEVDGLKRAYQKCWAAEGQDPYMKLADVTCEKLRIDPEFEPVLHFLKTCQPAMITTSSPKDLLLFDDEEDEEEEQQPTRHDMRKKRAVKQYGNKPNDPIELSDDEPPMKQRTPRARVPGSSNLKTLLARCANQDNNQETLISSLAPGQPDPTQIQEREALNSQQEAACNDPEFDEVDLQKFSFEKFFMF